MNLKSKIKCIRIGFLFSLSITCFAYAGNQGQSDYEKRKQDFLNTPVFKTTIDENNMNPKVSAELPKALQSRPIPPTLPLPPARQKTRTPASETSVPVAATSPKLEDSKTCGKDNWLGDYCYYRNKNSEWVICASRFGACLSRSDNSPKNEELENLTASQGPVFSFNLQLKKECALGILDQMEMDLNLSASQSLIATLENLSDEDTRVPVQVRDLNISNLQAGMKLSFEVPKNLGGASWGLFICKDASGLRKCRGKSVSDVAGGLIENIRGVKEENFSSNDQIYFFQSLLNDSHQNRAVSAALSYARYVNSVLRPTSVTTFSTGTKEFQIKMSQHQEGCNP